MEGTLQSVGVTVLFSDITELQELRDAAAALDKIKLLNQKLERLSFFDELTGLPNRRFFNDTCNREWYRMMRTQRPLAFIMIDVDCFKELNDQHGHQTGDACLIAVANTLNSVLKRPYDLIMRYGGDEFVIFLSCISSKGEVLRCVERIFRCFDNIYTDHVQNKNIANFSCSIGIAFSPENGENFDVLVERADMALYKAKRMGKNCCSIYSENIQYQ
ncbi:Phytochrome-like protein cph2 [bioreactor metagenome]|uniref:Phytochrome-like protein cph2 n=1 Tax=bioreactor metagenome TaxID=1076179 RepID=A0A645CNL5_9ZZZZ